MALRVAIKFIEGLCISQVSRKLVYGIDSFCIDPSISEFGTVPIVSRGWEEFYEVYIEAVHFGGSEPCDMHMKMKCFVDALNEVKWRFRTRSGRMPWNRAFLDVSSWHLE